MKSSSHIGTKGIGLLIVFLLLGLSIWTRCSKDHGPVAYRNPIDEGQVSIPPVPDDLQIQVGDRTITLSWDVGDTADVRWYRIARRDSSNGDLCVVDSVSESSYRDNGLKHDRL